MDNQNIECSYSNVDRELKRYREELDKFGKIVRKGYIYWVEKDPSELIIGSEQGKTRPVVIIQNDVGNEAGSTVIVAKITSAEHDKNSVPVNMFIEADNYNGLTKDSVILLNHLKTVDKKRLRSKIGELTPMQINELHKKLLISLGINVLYL